MSYKPNVFSNPGTPITDRTVGELVAEHPGRSRVFQSFQIDFCCQGGRTLREACALKSISLDAVVAQLKVDEVGKFSPDFNPAKLPPDQLAAYIVETHHEFLRCELPRLHSMAERVAQVHGKSNPSLVKLFETFIKLEVELSSHLLKEEQILFPAVTNLCQGLTLSGTLDGPIACMIQEHEEAGAAITHIRELTSNFEAPPEACNTYRALFAGLEDLESDLHRHIHLENSVLFPAAKVLVEAGVERS